MQSYRKLASTGFAQLSAVSLFFILYSSFFIYSPDGFALGS
jgi:hypothetical protein